MGSKGKFRWREDFGFTTGIGLEEAGTAWKGCGRSTEGEDGAATGGMEGIPWAGSAALDGRELGDETTGREWRKVIFPSAQSTNGL